MTVNRSAYLWLLDEKKKLAEEGYKEVMSSYERLKARLMSILTFSITLSSACYTGGTTNGSYAPLCLVMAFGFTGAALLCGLGLYPTSIRTKNEKSEALDAVMHNEPPVVSKEEAYQRLTQFIEATTEHNAQQLNKDRRYLKIAWVTLGTTPLVSFLIIFREKLPFFIIRALIVLKGFLLAHFC